MVKKGPSFFDIWEVIDKRQKYQYFCPKCRQGPLHTAHTLTECPACSVEIELQKTLDGDIFVKVAKSK